MTQRRIQCNHCGKELRISSRAFSVSCRYCNQRVGVEDHIINDYHAVTNIDTCGSLDVTTTGQIRAQIRVQNLNVGGQVYGDITAKGKVSVDSEARMVGDVTARSITVKPGARMKGFYRIEPQQKKGGNGG